MTFLKAAFGRSAGLGSQPLAGLSRLLRLNLRSERLSLLGWTVGVGALSPLTAHAFAGIYPQAHERLVFVQLAAENPAIRVITGPVYGSSLGALVTWRLGLTIAILTALLAIFTVIGHTRADEAAGRTELLASGAVGRLTPLAAALGTAGIGCLGIGLLTAGSMAAYGEDLVGSGFYGAGITLVGWVFAGIAAICAQIFDSARTARGYAGAVLGVAFAIRAIADGTGDLRWNKLRYTTPLGLFSEIQAYATNRGPILGLLLGLAILAAATAAHLLVRRDMSCGMRQRALGRAQGRVRSTGALATRLQRGAALGWLVALSGFGIITGALVDTAGKIVDSSSTTRQLILAMGGGTAIVATMIGALALLTASQAAIAAVSAATRLGTEERSDRTGLLLSTSTSRSTWLSSHARWVFGGPAAALAGAGLCAGLVRHWALSGQDDPGMTIIVDTLLAFLVQIPGVWVVGAAAIALFAQWPRLSGPFSWTLVTLSALLGMFGTVLNLPQWAINLSPLAHTQLVPVNPVPLTAMVTLTAIAAALYVLAVLAFRRREVVPY